MATNVVVDRRRFSRETRRLALAGILGPPFFVIVFLVLGFIKPGYDPVVRFVSEGSIGELGWIQIVNFLVFGATLLVFSLALWQGFGPRLSGRIGSVLIGIVGVGALAAGVFVADPDSQIIGKPGLVQRVMIIVVWTWLTILALRLWRASTPQRTVP